MQVSYIVLSWHSIIQLDQWSLIVKSHFKSFEGDVPQNNSTNAFPPSRGRAETREVHRPIGELVSWKGHVPFISQKC